MIWQLTLLAAALGAAYYIWSRRRLYRLAAELPCLPATCYPIIGHAYIFSGSNEDIMKALQKQGILSNQHDGLSCFWMGNRLFVNMTDPAAIEVVSKSCLDKDEFLTKFIRTAIGNGSIFAPVNNLNQLVPVFDKKSSIMAARLRAEAGGGEFSLWKYATTFTFDTICETAINEEINTQEKTEHTFFLSGIDQGTQLLAKRMMQPWLHPDLIYKKLRDYKEYQYHLQRGYTFVDEVIQKKKETAMQDHINNNELSHFIDLIKGYSDMELREELMVMLIAGTDSLATATCFTAVLLSRYPDVQDKVHRELQDVFGDSDRAVTTEDLSRLKYLEAVIKESLRLYPPVPMVVREVRKDVVLPSGTTLVDETTVMFNIWGTHRNPAYWGQDAEEFHPERFLEGALRHPAQFVPFSYSVRNCIGGTYAMLSARTALANVLRRYRLLPPGGARADLRRPLPVKYDITMKAVDHFVVRIQEKNLNL